jgi:hypothetical protein
MDRLCASVTYLFIIQSSAVINHFWWISLFIFFRVVIKDIFADGQICEF